MSCNLDGIFVEKRPHSISKCIKLIMNAISINCIFISQQVSTRCARQIILNNTVKINIARWNSTEPFWNRCGHFFLTWVNYEARQGLILYYLMFFLRFVVRISRQHAAVGFVVLLFFEAASSFSHIIYFTVHFEQLAASWSGLAACRFLKMMLLDIKSMLVVKIKFMARCLNCLFKIKRIGSDLIEFEGTN